MGGSGAGRGDRQDGGNGSFYCEKYASGGSFDFCNHIGKISSNVEYCISNENLQFMDIWYTPSLVRNQSWDGLFSCWRTCAACCYMWKAQQTYAAGGLQLSLPATRGIPTPIPRAAEGQHQADPNWLLGHQCAAAGASRTCGRQCSWLVLSMGILA